MMHPRGGRRYTGFEYGVEHEMTRRRARGIIKAMYWCLGVVMFVMCCLVLWVIGSVVG